MLLVLALVDVVMIANLLIMVSIGYETFVSRINLRNHPDQPEWFSHANVLKVKATSDDYWFTQPDSLPHCISCPPPSAPSGLSPGRSRSTSSPRSRFRG